MNLTVEMMKGILDVKCNCSIKELVGHIENLTHHYGGGPFTEKDIIPIIEEIENDEDEDIVLVKEDSIYGFETPNSHWKVIRCSF